MMKINRDYMEMLSIVPVFRLANFHVNDRQQASWAKMKLNASAH